MTSSHPPTLLYSTNRVDRGRATVILPVRRPFPSLVASNALRLPNLSAVHFCSTAFCPFPATATRGPQAPHRSTERNKWPASERGNRPPSPSPLFPLVFDDSLRPSFTERNLRPCRSPFHVTCSEAPASTTVAIHPPPPTATGSGAASNSFQPFQGCFGRRRTKAARRYLESGRVGRPNQRSPPGVSAAV